MNKTNFIVGIVFICFSLFYYFYLIPTQIISSTAESEFAGRIFRPETFPQITIAIFGLLSVLLAGNALREKGAPEFMSGSSRRSYFQAIFVFILAVIYVYALEWLGFHLTSPIFLAILIIFYGTRDWRFVTPVALLTPVVIERLFWFSFKVILPEGELFVGAS
ncbi:MAG: tripartite tricarboxylate transporter TctB family protein [Nitrospinota bacterium]